MGDFLSVLSLPLTRMYQVKKQVCISSGVLNMEKQMKASRVMIPLTTDFISSYLITKEAASTLNYKPGGFMALHAIKATTGVMPV